MNRKMLINATHPEEHRVAIVEDGALVELDIEITGKEQTRSNIYKGIVIRVETGLQAAFVDFGSERPGFLQIGEIHPSFAKNAQGSETKGRPRINDLLRRGQELLVQVVKEERGTKGAALTTFLSLPGRYMVLMPESDTKGVSRKIEQDSQRKKLKETMASIELPENIGYIVRTAGIGQKKTELKRDVDYLIRVYEKILDLGKKIKAPALVYKESNLVIRSIRDYFSSDIDEVLVDDPAVAREAKDFFDVVMPEYSKLVKLHQERRPIFSRYQIEEQIESISRNKVSLPSGGSIVIDSTEALVAVDVNSGKMASEQGVEGTAFKTNMEAAEETARQLRLRDLGGLIVIDFIDMRDRKHIREVEKRLKDGLKTDKARVTVGRISQFGLLEMSRQRIKSVLAAAAFLPCPHCEGTGRVKSAESQALDFLRRIYTGMAKGHIGQVDAEIPLEVASYLLNQKRSELLELERHYEAVVIIKGRPDFTAGQAEITFHKREKDHQVTTQEYIDAASGRSDTPDAATPEIPDQKQSEHSEQPAASDATEETGRKRKRPRRRRKSGEREADKAAAAAEDSGTTDIPSLAPAGITPERPSGEDLLEQFRSGRSHLAEMQERPVDTGRVIESAVSHPAPEVPTSPATPGTEKPHRKPRRRRKSSAHARQTGIDPGASADAVAGSTTAGEPQSLDHPAPKEQDKSPRQPRQRGKADLKDQPERQAEGSSDPVPSSAGETAAMTTPAPARNLADATEKQEPTAPSKPARPRRPRRPAKAADSAKADSPAETASSVPGKEETAEKKPARRTRSRKPKSDQLEGTAEKSEGKTEES
jgi:ribonuclease E